MIRMRMIEIMTRTSMIGDLSVGVDDAGMSEVVSPKVSEVSGCVSGISSPTRMKRPLFCKVKLNLEASEKGVYLPISVSQIRKDEYFSVSRAYSTEYVTSLEGMNPSPFLSVKVNSNTSMTTYPSGRNCASSSAVTDSVIFSALNEEL